jgi:DNA-binding winged helix-turn-helix (wHTH) protein
MAAAPEGQWRAAGRVAICAQPPVSERGPVPDNGGFPRNMPSGRYLFDRFLLDPADRQLRRDGAPVELNARYLDALALLVREQGRLISKDRFLEEVWAGVPVTDEALTQCIRTLRRQLGDDAAAPRFIETVPKHGYRFIAAVVPADADEEAAAAARAPAPSADPAPRPSPRHDWRCVLLLAGAGTIGGGLAGVIGGLFYGFAGASQPLQPGLGAASVLLVLLALTIVLALLGAAGVALGIAAASVTAPRDWAWHLAGGALGGLVVGAVVKLLGTDAFALLLGQSPGDVTGAGEGALLGGAVGLGTWLAGRIAERRTLRLGLAAAAAAGAAAGLVIALLGGRLLGGSLDQLARRLPDSRLRLDPIGALVGERAFGPVSHALTAALEGALFAAGVAAAIVLARRSLDAGE